MTARPSVVTTLAQAHEPPAVQSLAALGLPLNYLVEHFIRVLRVHDPDTVRDVAQCLRIPASIALEIGYEARQRKLVQVAGHAGGGADVRFQLLEQGVERAEQCLARCQYAGPLPVPLEEYVRQLERQGRRQQQFHQAQVREAYRDLVMPPDAVDRLGAAMNSGRATLIYGPPGSGKTFIASRLPAMLEGSIWVPHALYVAGDLVQVYDPMLHHAIDGHGGPVAAGSGATGAGSELVKPLLRARSDERWVQCRRPFVVVGGELTLAALELQFDPSTRFYQAPPQVKANGGMLLIDDLGRQLVAPRELMNRWIVPMDKHRDFLLLQNGFRFEMPFDLHLVFSTNLAPAQLADDAFLRRFGHKVHLGALTPEYYETLFRRECEALDVAFDADAFSWLVHERHGHSAMPLLACYPRDLLGRVRDHAVYEGVAAVADRVALDRAWHAYFVPAWAAGDGV